MPIVHTLQTMEAPTAETLGNSLGSPSATNSAASLNIISNPGPISVNADGSTTNHGHQRLNTASFTSPVKDGILSTARTSTGGPIMGDIKPADIITVNGVQMQASIAEQLGMISRDQSGRYAELSGGVEEASRAPERTTMEDGAVAFASPEAEQHLAELCSLTQPSSQVAVMQELITDGAISETTLNRAASEASKEPGEMSQRVQAVVAAFTAQANASVAAHGIENANDLWDWARQNRPNDLKHAMNQHGLTRDPKVYSGLAQEYVASLADHSPDDVLNAQFGGGMSAKKVNGQVVINIPGRGQIPYRAALKAGLIKVSGL